MSEGRALLTERERDALAGELSDSYRYKTRTFLRRRLEKLATDMETIAEHEPELYDEALEAVRQAGERDPTADADGSDVATPEPSKERDTDRVRAESDADTGDGSDSRRVRRESDTDALDADIRDAMDLPQGQNPEEAIAAVYAVRDHLREHGPASMREIVTDVMPDHPLGYDVPELESGDRYRGAWWRRIVQPGLRALPDVEYRQNHGDYRATGGPTNGE